MRKLIVVQPDMIKSHVKGYSRKDGSYVQEHDDKRQKKAEGPKAAEGYSHPHVVGKATVTDPHATGPADAACIQFAGTEYFTTSKKGKSFHDETGVREFESEDGHKVWMDDHGRVHADSVTEVPNLRKKSEAYSAGQQEAKGKVEARGAGAAGEKESASGGKPASGESPNLVATKEQVIGATLGQHNAALGYISVPPGKGQHKVEEFVDKVEGLGFSLAEGTTYDVNGDNVQLSKNETGKAVLEDPDGNQAIIMATDGGDRVRISVSYKPAAKTGDKAAGGAEATSGGPKPEKAPSGKKTGADGEKKPKPKAKEPKPKETGDEPPSGDGEIDDASREKLYQQANAAYTKHFTDKVQPVEKAYRDGKASIDDLLAVRSESKKLMAAADAEFDKLLKAAKGKKAPKGKGQGDLFKSEATGDTLDGRGPEHEDQQDDPDPGAPPKKKKGKGTLAKAIASGMRLLLK